MTRERPDELVFLPLGGVGEIGMNLGLYGFGPRKARKWLVVDFGVAFAREDMPGVDLILPDISYLEDERKNVVGIVITHAHEDHFGALLDLWPRLKLPVYATPFTANLLAAKAASEPGAEVVPVNVVKAGQRIELGPFDVEYINVAHSVPESHALAIRTPLGTVLHTGDWKLDDTPALGLPTDKKRLREIGDEGVLALVCDSTNATSEGRSASEAKVAEEIMAVMREARARIGFTTFASNVGRIRSIALAAREAGREVVLCGRALRRTIDVATELGMMDDMPSFHDEEAMQYLPRERVCAILTGSQGEPRAALARAAAGEHPRVNFDKGDLIVFSARAIPGNEIGIGRIMNGLAERGVDVITDRDRPIHVSGHPRRDELREMYRWTKPKIAVPVHGEPVHLAAHAQLARSMSVPDVVTISDGKMLRLAPGAPEVIDQLDVARLYKDGGIIGPSDAVGVSERRKMSFAGHVAVSLVLDNKGEHVADPDIQLTGIPLKDRHGDSMDDLVMDTVEDAVRAMPRAQRRDPDVVGEVVRRAVRSAINGAWGKKPICTVFVAVV